MHSEISNIDKFIILWNTGRKFSRGLIRRLFLKKASGLFLVGKRVSITHGKHIVCGRNVKFEDYSEIHGLCRDGLIFGDYVTIGRGVMIRPSSYYGGDYGSGLVIGEHSSIGPYAYVGCSGKIVIGKNVMFGPKCSLFAENHNFSDQSSWIGSNVIILDGVTIGKGSVIAAGTLISKDVPPGSVVMDKRNRLIRDR